MEFKNKLYELRKQRGMSQEELAGELHVARQTVSKWELGETVPDLEKLVSISELFGISLDQLVYGERTGKTAGDSAAAESAEPEAALKRIIQKLNTPKNRQRLLLALKCAAAAVAVLLAVDLLSLVIYLVLWGIPQ